MSDLLAARSQMAMSLAFHILFAIAGMAMPLLMVLAEWRYQRTGDAAALELAKRWAKGTAILFAAWMNQPASFDYVDGELTRIRPWEAMFNPSSAASRPARCAGVLRAARI